MALFNVFDALQNFTPRFTKDQLSDIMEWFEINSKPSSIEGEESINVITVEKLIQFLDFKKYHKRSFHYPSYSEIMKEIEKLNGVGARTISKHQFIYILDKWILMPDIKKELTLAFKVFDTEKRNFLETDDLKTIVTTHADVFNEAETRELLRDANVRGDGNVFYEDFIESLFSIAPELNQLKSEYLYENPYEDPTFLSQLITEDKSPTPPTTQVEMKVPVKKEKKKT